MTTSMNAIAYALLAVMATDHGDAAAAQAHIASAQRISRSTARRHRQVVEIAGLVVTGQSERAAGLALMHTTEFPEDADLLARVTGRPTP
jgi:DNA-binding IscR family transcriptional regulator